MDVTISRALADAILAHAAEATEIECCGLLFGSATQITAIASCRNISEDPARAFEIDPAALIEAHRAARHGGPVPVGCYHSHPNAAPRPSAQDAASADEAMPLWIIVAKGALSAWRFHAGKFSGAVLRYL